MTRMMNICLLDQELMLFFGLLVAQDLMALDRMRFM
jgi:hypothetical protein